MTVPGDESFMCQSRISAVGLKDYVFDLLKPQHGKTLCDITIHPGDDGDLILRQVVSFGVVVKISSDEMKHRLSLPDCETEHFYKKNLSTDIVDTDPILLLRKGKDDDLSYETISSYAGTNNNSIGRLPPKSFAIRRALKMAIRTAYKSKHPKLLLTCNVFIDDMCTATRACVFWLMCVLIVRRVAVRSWPVSTCVEL